MGEIMIKEIEIDGEIYKEINGKWVDSLYCEAPNAILQNIYSLNIDFTNLSQYSDEYLEENIIYLKNNNGQVTVSLRIIEYLYPKYVKQNDIQKINKFLPVYTSCLRAVKKPEEAIALFKIAKRNYGNLIVNVAIITSIAAAYIDIGDYEKAKRYCNWAYALQGGPQNAPNELSEVYARLDRSTQLKK